MTGFEPTPEQHQAREAFLTGGSLTIEACAGSGKTSTLKLLAQATRTTCLYIAFNRAIKDEAQASFPRHVTCKTSHSMAWSVGKLYQSNDRLKRRLLPRMLQQELHMSNTGSGACSAAFMARVLIQSLGKFCHSNDRTFSLKHLPESVCIDEEEEEHFRRSIAPYFSKTWARLTSPTCTLPVPHDLYLKQWALSDPKPPAKIIFLDEAQDANPLLLGLLARWQALGSQLVYVGDRYQQIYSWRGAINALEHLHTEHRVCLTQSFRYGEAVAKVANAVLRTHRGVESHIRGFEAIESRLEEEMQAPDAILCRTNACVIAELMEHVDTRACAIAGGVKELIALVRGVESLKQGKRAFNCPELAAFSTWDELELHADTELGQDLKPLIKLVETYGEEALLELLERVDQTREQDAELYLSTAHKAKGLEWENVQLADDFPTPYLGEERNPRWSEEEAHLLYVACTRAQHALDVSRCEAALDALARHKDSVSDVQQGLDGTSEPSHVQSHHPTHTHHPHRALLDSETFAQFLEAAHARGRSPEDLLAEMLLTLPQRQGSLW